MIKTSDLIEALVADARPEFVISLAAMLLTGVASAGAAFMRTTK